MREHWRTVAPPTYIAAAVIAASLGNKLTSDAAPGEINDEDQIAALMAAFPMT